MFYRLCISRCLWIFGRIRLKDRLQKSGITKMTADFQVHTLTILLPIHWAHLLVLYTAKTWHYLMYSILTLPCGQVR